MKVLTYIEMFKKCNNKYLNMNTSFITIKPIYKTRKYNRK